MLVVILGIVGATTSGSTKAEAKTEAIPITKAIAIEKPVEVTDQMLSLAYEDNPIAADEQFRGKRVSVIGRIDRIGREILGSPYIVLENDIQCGFSKADESLIARLKKGQKVMVTGEVRGLILLNVYIKDCELK
jgi:hypothetical protein